MKIDIIKYIVDVKLEEKELRLKVAENKEKQQKILEILKSKQNADLENKSVEELEKMLNDLSK